MRKQQELLVKEIEEQGKKLESGQYTIRPSRKSNETEAAALNDSDDLIQQKLLDFDLRKQKQEKRRQKEARRLERE